MNELSIRFIFYGAVFLATLLAIEGGYMYLRDQRMARRRINKRLEMIDRGVDRAAVLSFLRRDDSAARAYGPIAPLILWLERRLMQAGIRISAIQLAIIMLAVTGGVIAVGFVANLTIVRANVAASSLLLALFGAALGIGLPLLVISLKRDRRLKKFQEQFPVALDVFVRGLRAGHPVPAALDLLTHEMPDPIGSEFGIVTDEITYGLELRDALQNMADRLGIEDLHMFVVSVSIQGETGGNLAEILDNLSRVIRDRASMVLKVRALSSEGRMSGIMLSALPVLTFCGVFTLSPEFFLDVADEPAFFPAVFILLGLYSFGFWMIRRMIDLKV